MKSITVDHVFAVASKAYLERQTQKKPMAKMFKDL
jgi:hypothetical protein